MNKEFDYFEAVEYQMAKRMRCEWCERYLEPHDMRQFDGSYVCEDCETMQGLCGDVSD